jgi:hypothetical protein
MTAPDRLLVECVPGRATGPAFSAVARMYLP